MNKKIQTSINEKKQNKNTFQWLISSYNSMNLDFFNNSKQKFDFLTNGY